jgi:hypothetical protein
MTDAQKAYRARTRAKAALAKAERWLAYLEEQTALATQAKADAEAELSRLGIAPADPTLTKLLDDL